jgi:hypothetical protein
MFPRKRFYDQKLMDFLVVSLRWCDMNAQVGCFARSSAE